MGFSCGLIGLPNVGKTTLFNALTLSHAAAENYPFCTVDPNHGIVEVPDLRLRKVADIFSPEKVTPTTLEFVDIAGLVKGASQGEGLGNQFLAQIQQVDAVIHVVRCFADDNVVHSYGTIEPVRDAEIVITELMLRDLDMVQKRLGKQQKVAKGGDKDARREVEVLERVEKALAGATPVSSLELDDEALACTSHTPFLTAKPVVIVANIADSQLGAGSDPVLESLRDFCRRMEIPQVEISVRTESELDELDPDEQQAYRQELGIAKSGLDQIITAGYRLLDLITFFTTVGTEVRAWTVPAGTSAVRAAGKIHSDMERGFIRAEVISSAELVESGSEQCARDKGLIRSEGKEYRVMDGDVIRFRFNV